MANILGVYDWNIEFFSIDASSLIYRLWTKGLQDFCKKDQILESAQSLPPESTLKSSWHKNIDNVS